jgi:hypothetical protein
MALSKPHLENGWLSKAITEPEKTFTSVTAQAYNPYAYPSRQAEDEDLRSCTQPESEG